MKYFEPRTLRGKLSKICDMKMEMYLFQEVRKLELGWENQFQFPNLLEEAFSDITVISQQISSL